MTPKIQNGQKFNKKFNIKGKALKEVYMVICGLWIYLRQSLHMTGAGVDLWPQKSKMAEIFNKKIMLRGLKPSLHNKIKKTCK